MFEIATMKLIAVSQRVDIHVTRNERRDALDQNWFSLLFKAGFLAVALPNNNRAVEELFKELPISGVIFTGGNDLLEYGGDAPERDEMEFLLLTYLIEQRIPVLGVCRGMQLMQSFWGIPLQKVSNQVLVKQEIKINHELEWVNSFHHWGSFYCHKNFRINRRNI